MTDLEYFVGAIEIETLEIGESTQATVCVEVSCCTVSTSEIKDGKIQALTSNLKITEPRCFARAEYADDPVACIADLADGIYQRHIESHSITKANRPAPSKIPALTSTAIQIRRETIEAARVDQERLQQEAAAAKETTDGTGEAQASMEG